MTLETPPPPEWLAEPTSIGSGSSRSASNTEQAPNTIPCASAAQSSILRLQMNGEAVAKVDNVGRVSTLLGLLALVSLAGPLWVLGRDDLATQFTDDAFYYFQIARNVAHGHGATFDGVHATTGFHPLWLVLLVPVFALPGYDLPVRLAGTLEAALVASAAVLIYRSLVMRWGQRPALLAALLLFSTPGARGVLRTGLEGALVLVLLVLAWRAWLVCRASEPRTYLWLSVWLALLALARVEAIAITVVIAAADRRALRTELRSAAALVLPPVAALLIYLAVNIARVGLAIPISGLTKRAWTTQYAAFDVLGLGLAVPRSAPASLALALVACALGYGLLRRWPRLLAQLQGCRVDWLILAGGATLAVQLATLGTIERWYWGPIFPGLAMLAAAVLSARTLQAVAIGLAIMSALARVPYAVLAQDQRLQGRVRREAADALTRHTPEGAIIGAWNGGVLGYYSDRHIVMLDGLANDATFYRRVTLGHDLDGYLRDERIEWLAMTGCKPPAFQSATTHWSQRYERIAVLAYDPNTAPCNAFTLWTIRSPRAQQ